MSIIDKLVEHFREFPGIGSRQAKRFVYFLLSRNKDYLEELSILIKNIQSEINICEKCFRFFNSEKSKLCRICRDENRDDSILLVVEKDIDLENIERSGAYRGKYFVLGGIIPILEKDPERKVRLSELQQRINSSPLSEIILAFAVNADGEHTTDFLIQFIKEKKKDLKVSILGRGVSTGAEVEYLDSNTIENAIKNRS